MKSANNILIITLLAFITGCGGGRQSADDLIIVDVTKSYPKKELILQDFMDVEYVALETADEFLTQGVVQDVGKEIILVTNRINDGDIFVFDRKTGKGISKINRKGHGGEEYAFINKIVLDEENNEIFVNSWGVGKILVYDLYGKFKRSFNAEFSNIFEYDRDNFIGYDMSGFHKDGEDRDNTSYHVIISKQDGSMTRNIYIPFKQFVSPIVRKGEGVASSPSLNYTIPFFDNWVLVESSSDTLYNYAPDGRLTPFIVRVPPIHAMDIKVFLSLRFITDNYYFMFTLKSDFDFETGRGFYEESLMYDKQENSLFQYVIYNSDYTEKNPMSLNSRPLNYDIPTYRVLEAYRLVEDYEKGFLKGRLKEIAAELDAEDNPVIMLVKHKQ